MNVFEQIKMILQNKLLSKLFISVFATKNRLQFNRSDSFMQLKLNQISFSCTRNVKM